MGYYGVALAVFGTIGNLISFGICLRPSLRNTPTFVFLACMMLVDTLGLYFFNLNVFFSFTYGLYAGDYSREACISTSFLQGFSFQSSAFLLVIIGKYAVFV
jgi:hypothetical protein